MHKDFRQKWQDRRYITTGSDFQVASAIVGARKN